MQNNRCFFLYWSSLCEPWRFIRPNEITTYMFYLKPRPDIPFEQLYSTPTLGKLDISWMSGFGERGRLQTNQLPKPVYFFSRSLIFSIQLSLDSFDNHDKYRLSTWSSCISNQRSRSMFSRTTTNNSHSNSKLYTTFNGFVVDIW